MLWTKVIGQKNLRNKLEYLIKTKQVPHSQLFTGSSGYGSLPLAIEFSLFLLEDKNVSNITKKLSKRCQHPDLHFVLPVVKKKNEKVVYSHDYIHDWLMFIDDRPYGKYSEWFEYINVGNRQGLIGIADIENIRKKISLKAFNGGARVCIVWGAEKMNNQASNAFLKILEEPAKNTFFLLIAENEEEILPTIISRCQIVNLGPIENSALRNAIEKKADNPETLVAKAQGDFNDLLNLISSDRDKEYEALLIQGLRIAFKVNGNKKLPIVSKKNLFTTFKNNHNDEISEIFFVKDLNNVTNIDSDLSFFTKVIVDLMDWSASLCGFGKEEQKTFLEFSVQFFRDAYLSNYSLNDIVTFKSKTNFDILKIAPYINIKNVKELVSLFEQTRFNIIRNVNVKMLFMNLAFKLSELIYVESK